MIIAKGMGTVSSPSITMSPYGPVSTGGANLISWADMWWNKFQYGNNYPTPPSPVVGAPQTQQDMTSGLFTPLDAAQQGAADYSGALSKFYSSVDANVNNPSNMSNTWLWIVAGALGLLILAEFMKRR